MDLNNNNLPNQSNTINNTTPPQIQPSENQAQILSQTTPTVTSQQNFGMVNGTEIKSPNKKKTRLFIGLALIVAVAVLSLGYWKFASKHKTNETPTKSAQVTTPSNKNTGSNSLNNSIAWKSSVPKVITPLDNQPITGKMIPSEKTKALVPTDFSLGLNKVTATGYLQNYSKTEGIATKVINMSEGNGRTYDGKVVDYQATIDTNKTDSKNEFTEFTYLGQPGVIMSESLAKQFTPNEYWIYYNHNGVLVTVHTNDVEDMPLDKLIEVFKSLGK